MRSRRIELVTLSLAALVFAGSIATWFGASPRAAAAEGKDTKARTLLKEKHATLELAARLSDSYYEAGRIPFDQVVEANRAAFNAELDLCDTDRERSAVLEKMLTNAKILENKAEALVDVGRGTRLDIYKAKADRLDIEIALARATAK